MVVGETPYSEGFGDVYGPRWAFDPGDNGVPRPVKNMQLSGADKAAVDRVCRAVDCVVVVVSGRPLILDDQQLNKIDSLVAAWLPGSEGGGVADDLFGAEPYTGKLPVSWPRSLGAGADQHRRSRLRPALSVRIRTPDGGGARLDQEVQAGG